MPLKVLDIQRQSAAIFNGGGLVLSPPDQHVTWRGHTMPIDPLALIDRVRGAATKVSKDCDRPGGLNRA